MCIESSAVFDEDEMYRYKLSRVWDEEKPRAVLVLWNPSTADHYKNDLTVNSCINYFIDHGYGSMDLVNLFAARCTKPNQLKSFNDPIGVDNNYYISESLKQADLILLGWGSCTGSQMKKKRAVEVLQMIRPYKDICYCFGFVGDHDPKHPKIIAKEDYLQGYFS